MDVKKLKAIIIIVHVITTLGILCGECVNGNGITVLLNICSQQCDTGYVAFVPALSMINH